MIIGRKITSDAYCPVKAITKIKPIPLLITQNTNDRVISMKHAQRLYEAAKEPKQLWIVQDTDHIRALNKQEIRVRLNQYLSRILQ